MKTKILLAWLMLSVLSGLYLGFSIITANSLGTKISLVVFISGLLVLNKLTSEK